MPKITRTKMHHALLGAALLSLSAGSTDATITVEGTDAEKALINAAIQRIKDGSPEGKTCFEMLEAEAQEVKIRFGPTDDIAIADGTNYVVTLDKKSIDCLMQIDKPGGGGRALESSSLDLIIVHEMLGHLLNKLKGNKWGEDEAMAKTNKVRMDLGLPTRTDYDKIEGDKAVIPFSDQSKVDLTKAAEKKKPAKNAPGARKYSGVAIDATIPVVSIYDPGLDSWQVQLDPNSTGGQLQIDMTPLGEPPVLVPVQAFLLQFTNSSQPDFPIEIVSLGLQFPPVPFLGDSTGPNQFQLINEGRGGAGRLPPHPTLPGFEPDFGGDYLWVNPLWSAIGFDGYVVGQIQGQLIEDAPNLYIGNISLTMVGYVPTPFCVADVTTTNTNPGDPAYGEPDGVADGADLSFFVEAWLAGDPMIADVTTTNTNPGEPGYGGPDGQVDGADLSYFVEQWLAGCV